MPLQHSLSFMPTSASVRLCASQGVRDQEATVFLVTGAGGSGSDLASRLLERALADSGIAAHEPEPLAARYDRTSEYRQRRASQPWTLIAFGAEAAADYLKRPVSLNLERGRLRPLPDGSRMLITEHPRAILRLADPVARGREYRRLVNDLLMAVPRARFAA